MPKIGSVGRQIQYIAQICRSFFQKKFWRRLYAIPFAKQVEARGRYAGQHQNDGQRDCHSDGICRFVLSESAFYSAIWHYAAAIQKTKFASVRPTKRLIYRKISLQKQRRPRSSFQSRLRQITFLFFLSLYHKITCIFCTKWPDFLRITFFAADSHECGFAGWGARRGECPKCGTRKFRRTQNPIAWPVRCCSWLVCSPHEPPSIFYQQL